LKNILFIFGTRPEAIKLAPLIQEFQKHKDDFVTKICVTGQHRHLLDQVTKFFHIVVDYDLNLMKPNQTLFDMTSDGIKGLKKIIQQSHPHIIFVQGDTTTALIGALSGFYEKVKVSHIEAGLRSKNKYSPYPEEINRRLVDHIADYLFVPTENALDNLRNEGIVENVWNVGNTVIDALLLGLRVIREGQEDAYYDFFNFIDFSKKIILITGHRRESFGKPLENICNALRSISKKYKNVELVYPVHLNPNVKKPVHKLLKGIENVHLIEPLDYPHLVWLMNKCHFILTDSGGIQEEAPSLGKPVLVMREVTERIEGIKAGTARLVGTNTALIMNEVNKLINNDDHYNKMANTVNPYGDGKTSQRIVEILTNIIQSGQ
jgi:UDP-N-acetylglucosamine 2-epimerase (non-hydrolysing)